MKFIKILMLISLLSMAYITASYAHSDLNLSLSLQVRFNQIGLIDPLRFQVIIINTGNSDLKELAPWSVLGYMIVEYRGPGITDWKLLETPYLTRHSAEVRGGDPDTLTLLAGETKTVDLVSLYDSSLSYQKKKICYYFDKYGEYKIRTRYEPREGVVMFSNEAAFQVIPYKGPDADAYEWLKDKRIPHFMYEMSLIHSGTLRLYRIEDASELIERFPESRFVPWAKIYLANCYRYGCCIKEGKKEPRDFDKAAGLAQELLTSYDPDIRTEAEKMEAGIKQKRLYERQIKQK